MKILFIIICLLYGGVVVAMCELLPPQTAIPLVGVICFTQFVAVLWLLLFWRIPYEKMCHPGSNIIPLTDPGPKVESPK